MIAMLEMVVLWLVSVAHPRQRMTIDGHSHHLRLPRGSTWLNELLQHAGVPCSWSSGHVLQADKFKLEGLLQVDTSQIRPFNGSLTSWSREGMLLHEYYHSPIDSFVVPATCVFQLDEARPVYAKMDRIAIDWS